LTVFVVRYSIVHKYNFYFIDTADTYTKIATSVEKLAAQEADKELQKFLLKTCDTFEKLRKLEARVATDEELKQSDTLRYFMRDTQAAKVNLFGVKHGAFI
jgi:sorting nexin-5/6/32